MNALFPSPGGEGLGVRPGSRSGGGNKEWEIVKDRI